KSAKETAVLAFAAGDFARFRPRRKDNASRAKGRAPAGLPKAGGGTMKWVTGMLALLAVVSGCVSLNKGSDQVALLAPSKDEAEKQSLSSAPAKVPAVTVAAATKTPDRPRVGSRREADLTAEVKARTLPPGTEL